MFENQNDTLIRQQDYKSIFNQRANAYHQAMLMHPNARDQEFQAVLDYARLASGDHVVDYPAGGGYLSWYTPDHIELTHLETSQLFAELGHSRSPHPLYLCDDHTLPLADDSVDWLLSVAGLHHVMDKQALFNEFARVLKPAAQLILADASQGSKVAEFLDGWVDSHSSLGHSGSYFNNRTLKELSSAGLALLRLQEKHYHWVFPDKMAAAHYCKHMFGVDLASDMQVLNALEHYLGFDVLPEGVGLKWQLQFIQCIKPVRHFD